jgi:serine/threonine protein kinase/outer membrane protein assembly factor BamB
MLEPCGPGDPSRIGPYILRARLGVGGFGTVYVASRRDRPGELAAVKVVHGNVASAPKFAFRFAREIAAIKRVSSEYVPKLLDEGPRDQPPWLATELIPGLSLDRVARHCGPLPEAAVWALATAIAEGLAAIHGAGLVHRDLKPQNVLLLPAGPRIIDFSLVRLTELPHHSMSQHPIATLQYAAPEQVLGGLAASGAPADIFALGATLLYAATGHPPYDADTQSALLDRVQNARPNLTGLPGGLYPVVTRCLLRSIDARPVLEELQEEFSRRTGRLTGPGQEVFAEILPSAVVSLLEAYQHELTGLAPAGTATRWQSPAAPLPDGTTLLNREPVPLPPAGLAEPRPQDARDRSTRLLTGFPAEEVSTSAEPTPAAAETTRVAPLAAADDEQDVKPLPAVLPPSGQVTWVCQLGDWTRAPVAVGADLAIATCLNGTVTIMGADTGKVWWEYGTQSTVHSAALLLPVGYPDGKAYVGTADGGVHIFDIGPKSHRALFHAAGAITGSPVAAGGKVYVLSADGYVHVVDQYTSDWDVLFQMDAPATGTPVAGEGTLVVSDSAGTVYAVDLVTRRERWRLPTHGLVFGAPAIADGRLYFAATDGLLRSVHLHDERERGAVDIEAPVHASLAHDQRFVYVGCSDGNLRAFDISAPPGRSGPVQAWETPLNDEINGLAAAGTRVYVTAGDRVVDLNSSDGNIIRQIKMNCEVAAPPVVSGRFIYVTSLGGAVTCLPTG